MSNDYAELDPTIQISAGTAFKLGFFGALGFFVFYLILAVIAGVVGADPVRRRAVCPTWPSC